MHKFQSFDNCMYVSNTQTLFIIRSITIILPSQLFALRCKYCFNFFFIVLCSKSKEFEILPYFYIYTHTHTHTEYMAYVQCMYTHKSRSTDVWIREETFYSLVVILVSLSCTSVPYEGDDMRVSATCISWGMGSCNTGEELLLNE